MNPQEYRAMLNEVARELVLKVSLRVGVLCLVLGLGVGIVIGMELR